MFKVCAYIKSSTLFHTHFLFCVLLVFPCLNFALWTFYEFSSNTFWMCGRISERIPINRIPFDKFTNHLIGLDDDGECESPLSIMGLAIFWE